MAKNKDRKLFDRDRFIGCEEGGPGKEVKVGGPRIIQDLLDEGRRVNKASQGIMNTPAPAPFITFNKAQNEKTLSNGNAYITLGADRPSHEASGQGAVGADSPTIDLVVGRMASSHGGSGPKDGMFVGNSMFADAARIYISRSTKVDHNFGIAMTPAEQDFYKDGVEPQRSAIAVKADKVRIIGRAGVKIITGGARDIKGYGSGDRRGETDSFGNKLEPAPQIDLIAGNTVSSQQWLSLLGKGETYLQPIALGMRTRDALKDLAEMLDHLMGLLFQSELLTMTALSGIGAALSPLSAVTAADATARNVYAVGPSYNLRQTMTEFEGLYLIPKAPRAVWSRNVNAT